MIRLTNKPDVFDDRSRVRTEVPFRGGVVSDYLPDDYEPNELTAAVTLNGVTLDQSTLDTTSVADGDWIGSCRSPRGWVGVVIQVAFAIYGVWSAYDGARRAKITAHHARQRAAARAANMPDSATYGWGGMQNTINPGTNIAVLFGESKVAGHVILGEILGAHQHLASLLIGISEGECEGLVAGTVEINNKLATDFSGVSIDHRVGTTSQSALNSIYPTTVPRLQVASGSNIASSAASVTAGENADAFKVSVTLAANVKITTPLGPGGGSIRWGKANFTFQVRYRIGVGAWTVAGTFQTGFLSTTTLTSADNFVRALPKTYTWKLPALITQADYEVEVSVLSVATAYSVWNGSTNTWIVDNTATMNAGASTITLDHVQFFREFAPIYPGLAVLGVGAIPLQAIGGVLPTVTSIWQGRKLADITAAGPPATFTSERFNSPTIAGYTPGRNPALAILDILRTERYGVGSFLTVDDDLDVQSFIDARDFCDRLVSRGLDSTNPIKSSTGDGAPSAASNTFNVSVDPGFTDGVVKVDDTLVIETGADAGTYRVGAVVDTDTLNVTTAVAPFATVSFIGSSGVDWHINNTERASLCDLNFDGTSDVKKAVHAIAQNARLMVVKASGRIKLVPDNLRSISAVFGMGNIHRDTYTHYYGGRVGANRVEVQFLDVDKNYEQDIAVYEDPQALTNTEGVVPTQIAAFGITRRTEALRVAKYHWLSNRFEDEVIQLSIGASALMLEVGDVFSVAHDAISKSGTINRDKSGRFTGNPSGTLLDLDSFYTFDGTEIISVQSQADDTIHLITPSSPLNVPTRQIDVSSFGGYTPQDGDPWNTNPLFADDPADNTFRVTQITRSEDHVRQVRAVRYHPHVFSSPETDANSLLTNADVVHLAAVNP